MAFGIAKISLVRDKKSDSGDQSGAASHKAGFHLLLGVKSGDTEVPDRNLAGRLNLSTDLPKKSK
jgi:hypothetical protein